MLIRLAWISHCALLNSLASPWLTLPSPRNHLALILRGWWGPQHRLRTDCRYTPHWQIRVGYGISHYISILSHPDFTKECWWVAVRHCGFVTRIILYVFVLLPSGNLTQLAENLAFVDVLPMDDVDFPASYVRLPPDNFQDLFVWKLQAIQVSPEPIIKAESSGGDKP